MQLYFYDTDNELQNRLDIMNDSNQIAGTMSRILLLMENNPHAKIFQRLKDYDSFTNLKVIIDRNQRMDQRVFILL